MSIPIDTFHAISKRNERLIYKTKMVESENGFAAHVEAWIIRIGFLLAKDDTTRHLD